MSWDSLRVRDLGIRRSEVKPELKVSSQIDGWQRILQSGDGDKERRESESQFWHQVVGVEVWL